jgi:hypothetical protein
MIEEHIMDCIKSFDNDEQDSVRLLVVDVAIAAGTCLSKHSATALNKTLIEPLVTGM